MTPFTMCVVGALLLLGSARPSELAPGIAPDGVASSTEQTSSARRLPQHETGTVTDIDGNTYRTVKIGTQWWMAEDLRVTHDAAGQPIESRAYGDDETLVAVYGRLYTWQAAMNGATEPGAQGIAPDGWHIPSDEDWDVLFAFLGGASVAGGKLKETGTEHWFPPNTDASNASGFGGRPGGGSNGRIFEGRGVGGHYWSSTGAGREAGAPTLHKDEAAVTRLRIPKTFFASVRCVRDADDTGEMDKAE